MNIVLLNNWFENLVIFYFIGMIISRIGSLIIEPVLKRNKRLEYIALENYIKASKKDSRLETLSEVNNTYRTLLSTFICIFAYKIYIVIEPFLDECAHWQNYNKFIFIFLLILLFFSAYKKQTAFIKKRAKTALEDNN